MSPTGTIDPLPDRRPPAPSTILLAVNGTTIQRTRVDSTAIASVGYEPRNRLLEVEFSSGKIYRYFDVPHDAFRRFLGAASKGSWFNQAIRDRFTYALAQAPSATEK